MNRGPVVSRKKDVAMASPVECPNCDAWWPPGTVRCNCGFNFTEQTMRFPLIPRFGAAAEESGCHRRAYCG